MEESRVRTPEPLEVVGWRFDELRRAGYSIDDALRLAELRDVDLHVACSLLENGCSPEDALLILL